MTIISGHQRIRAAKELGMTLVPIKIDEDLQDENSKLRALISNNFGRRKNDPAKDRKALATYVELNGYKHGEIGNGREKKDHNGLSTLDEIAKELNMSTTNLKRALRIERNLTDSMKELLDTGVITRTLAKEFYRCHLWQRLLMSSEIKNIEQGDDTYAVQRFGMERCCFRWCTCMQPL